MLTEVSSYGVFGFLQTWCFTLRPNILTLVSSVPNTLTQKPSCFFQILFHKLLQPEQSFLVKFSKLFSPTIDLQQLSPVHFIYIRQIHNECHLLGSFQENMSKKPKFYRFIIKVRKLQSSTCSPF